MKTKNLYILAIGFFSLLFIVFLGVVPFLVFVNYPWIAISIVLVFIIVFLILYIVNIPGYKMYIFYDHVGITKIQKVQGLKYPYHKAKYPYSCGPSAMRMYLETIGICMDEEEIIEISGDKSLGTSPWEIEEALNKIFQKKGYHYQARKQSYTKYSELFDAIARKQGVIVMFINQFYEENYPSYASYPHFALLNYINIGSKIKESEDEEKGNHSKNKEKTEGQTNEEKNIGKVILTNPSYVAGKNPYFIEGKYDGEIKMSIPEFQERFYMSQRYLNRMRYKPTRTKNFLLNAWNRVVNFLFILAFYVGYCIRILKPGTAIFIEKIRKQ